MLFKFDDLNKVLALIEFFVVVDVVGGRLSLFK